VFVRVGEGQRPEVVTVKLLAAAALGAVEAVQRVNPGTLLAEAANLAFHDYAVLFLVRHADLVAHAALTFISEIHFAVDDLAQYSTSTCCDHPPETSELFVKKKYRFI
jgi:hypothetical protein